MIITFDAHGDIALVEPEDLKRFHLAGIRPSRDDLEDWTRRGMELDDDAAHARVDPATVLAMAEDGRDLPEAWRADFEAMVSYAASKGWTDERGWLRGHTEWQTG